MEVAVLPCNIRTVMVRIYKRGEHSNRSTLTFPKDIVTRYNIQDKDEIVICYLCKAGENIEDVQKSTTKEKQD